MRLYFTIETQKGIRVTIIWAAVFVKQNILMDHSVRFLRETWENGWNHPFYVLTACRLPWYRHSFNQLSSVVCDENMIVVVLVPTLVTWTQIPESRVCWHAFTIREGSDQVHCIGLQPLIRIHCRFSAKVDQTHVGLCQKSPKCQPASTTKVWFLKGYNWLLGRYPKKDYKILCRGNFTKRQPPSSRDFSR